MDFTLERYIDLVNVLLKSEFKFYSFEQIQSNQLQIQKKNIIIIRHDIDRYSSSILKMAEMEHEVGINASYYFPEKIIYKYPDIISRVSDFAHEIGYHYNDFSCSINIEEAWTSFKKNLNKLRNICEVKTICMDGKPLYSKDNRELWTEFDYKDLGITGEIYLDFDYNEFAYYTDTGRRWDNAAVNIRDKVTTNKEFPVYKSTFEMIEAIKTGNFPQKAVINIHPEHWTDDIIDWYRKQIWQSTKNIAKYFLIQYRTWKSEHSVF